MIALKRTLVLLFCILGFPWEALGYPSFVGYGYSACLTCHYNPYGNGPLNDYGRALGATAISARPFWVSPKTTDEQLGEQSGFLGSTKMPQWFRPSADFRGMLYSANIKDEQSEARFIPMQLEANLVFKGAGDRMYGVLTLGYAPPPAALPEEEANRTPTLIAREHYVGYRVSKAVGLYLGSMDLAYGIRIPEHTAYSRVHTGLTMNDQVHGLLTHLILKNWEIGFQAFMGNLYQDSSLRQAGVSLMVERDLNPKLRIGISALHSSNQYRARQLGALMLRTGVGEGTGVLLEAGLIRQAPFISEASIGQYVFLQSTSRLTRGIHWLMTFETFTRSISDEDAARDYRFGPGLQIFPMQRLELRVDFLASRRHGQGLVSADNFSLLSQVHLWL